MTVVGAGIIGVSCSYRLARYGDVQVTLVDPSLPGGGTSSTGMAWLNASNKRPRDYFELNYAGVREYHRMKEELDLDWIHLSGSIASERYTPNLPSRLDELEGWGYPVERVRGKEIEERFGIGIRVGDPEELFAHYPAEGWIDVPGALSYMMAEAARGDFSYRFGCPVTSVERTPGAFRVTLGDGTQFLSDYVVNAAGPKADRVARMLGRHLPLAPTKGLTLRLHAPDTAIEKVVLSEAVDIRPDGPECFRIHNNAVDGLMAQGAATDRPELVAELFGRAVEVVPELKAARIVAEYFGIRPIPADSFSSIGEVAGLPGYIEAVTHSGVTMGPLVGGMVADLVRTGNRSELLTNRFSPSRFTEEEDF
ncbi:NAD(P)/FAD-dependent oxidoreductase [Streptomyces zingiberis]|uniref:FAD-binding oxidoreductase n=1 Tax=Streptomyces zingiberis TaxID=2053010 RepID=A0ABX1BRY5_9ACTN|nr:FAD-dependent oxidoreductase [Streptomyces zingiberis]NJQ00482.1 FAD-binding oxidoreductase [Streptomyces zingiberis]